MSKLLQILANAITEAGDLQETIERADEELLSQGDQLDMLNRLIDNLRQQLASSREEHLKTQEVLRETTLVLAESTATLAETIDDFEDLHDELMAMSSLADINLELADGRGNTLDAIAHMLGVEDFGYNYETIYTAIASLQVDLEAHKRERFNIGYGPVPPSEPVTLPAGTLVTSGNISVSQVNSGKSPFESSY